MNRMGMFVDISHVSFETMEDVYSVSRAPGDYHLFLVFLP